MTLKKSLLFIAFFVVFSLKAEFVSRQKAEMTASNFVFEQLINELVTTDFQETDLALIKTFTNDLNNKPLMYVFSLNDVGFIIISADDNAYPVLGFSFENYFNKDNLAPAFAQWLKNYTHQIQSLSENSGEQNFKPVWDYFSKRSNIIRNTAKAKNVAPLLTTTWDQGVYYNALCPEDPAGPGNRVYAGCVATAMAQVMKYYNYPQVGMGTHGYNDWSYGWQSADFGNTTYNWEAMTNSLNGHNFEVARLLYHCGVAVEMGYSPDGSGALSEDVVSASVNYFRYSNSTNIQDKENFSDVQWNNMLKDNIDNLMPLYYSGYSDEGGHAFNCDGYNETPNGTFFHFNWGWGGYGNGYFYIDNMNSPGGNFNYWHQAIFDMKPGANYPYNCSSTKVLSATAGTFEDGSGYFEYLNNKTCYWLIDPVTNIINIKLQFDVFDTENANDIVNVYDGETTADPLLGSFSGNSLPPVIQSTGKKMLVEFITNGSIRKQGWKTSYTTTKPVYCPNVTVLDDPSGTFSDGSDAYNYNINTSCRWRIEPPGAGTITIGFNDFNIDAQDATLEVFDVSSSPYVLLDTYMGSQTPPTKTYNASKILLWFKTGQNAASGWTAFYNSVVLSSNTLDNDRKINLFPSPFTQQLNISFLDDHSNKIIEVFDVNQQLVYTITSSESNLLMPLDFLSGGIYTIRIIYDSGEVVFRKVVRL
ncbi:MAG: C10 family peptidase [Bacteroidales bacterium]|nr:C10 family peptidase [Bacteroidales bacterium]